MITRYELAARHPDGRAFLICYTPRKSRPGIVAAVQQRGRAIVDKLQLPEHARIVWDAKAKEFAMHEWRIGFTGRTQIDAAHQDAAGQAALLPYVAA